MRIFFLRIVQALFYSSKSFTKNKSSYKAGSLTFYSVMAIIPFFALCFSVAKWIGLQVPLEKGLIESLKDQKDIVMRLLPIINNAIEQTKGGILAAISIIFFLWSVSKLLFHIEDAFNQTWHVEGKIKWRTKIGRYILIALIVPVFLIFTGVLQVISFDYIKITVFSFIFEALAFVMPYVLSWLLFLVVYYLIPRTKIPFLSALISSFIAGITFQIVQAGYLIFQANAIRYGAIYGSFAAFPLFLIWIQLSWLIVLWGAEICFCYQNIEYCKIEKKWLNISHKDQIVLLLWVVKLNMEFQKENSEAMTIKEMSYKSKIPLFPLKKLISFLLSCKLIKEVKIKNNTKGYLVISKVLSYKIMDLVNILESHGKKNVIWVKSNKYVLIQRNLKKFYNIIKKSSENVLLKNIGCKK